MSTIETNRPAGLPLPADDQGGPGAPAAAKTPKRLAGELAVAIVVIAGLAVA